MRTPDLNNHIETLKFDLYALRRAFRRGRISLGYYRELRWNILEDLRYWRSFARQE